MRKISLNERKRIEADIRMVCAKIAAAEGEYWKGIGEAGAGGPDAASIGDVAIGAVGASGNICGAILLGRSVEQHEAEISRRGKRESTVTGTEG